MNAMSDNAAVTMRVLIYKDQGLWLAQCLEYDLVAQAASFKDVKYEFERTIVGHILACLENGLVPFAHVPQAPQEYWKMFEDAEEAKLDIRGKHDWPEFTLPSSVAQLRRIPKRPTEVRMHVN